MALICCPECMKQVSDKADYCPHCGLPKRYFALDNNEEKNVPFIKSKEKEIVNYKVIPNMLIAFDMDYSAIFNTDNYITSSKARTFYNNYSIYIEMLKNSEAEQDIKNNSYRIGFTVEQCERFISAMNSFYEKIDKFNETYVNNKLIDYKNYFDSILKSVDPNVKLDEEQRRAVVTDDDYCLLIAGAGAGKTTTMAAKVKYLVEKQGIDPQDIIVISYTNKAIDELKERINEKLKIPVKISTFHSFGYEILRKANDTPLMVNYKSYNIIFDFLEKKIFNNKRLLSNLVKFLGFYFDVPEDIFNFTSLNDYCSYKANLDYETIKSRLGEYIKTVTNSRTKKTRTITGEFLRSAQEVQIANFLYLNNIDYEYEKPYKYPMPGSSKLYTPDFYISQGENECFLEHFGITENYQSELYNKTQLDQYARRIVDKRKLHIQHGTKLIQTWSKYNDNRSLVEHLEEELKKNGFILVPRDDEEVYRKLTETGKDKYVYKLIIFLIEFIEKFKTCGFDEDGFKVLKNKTDNVRSRMFLEIAEEVYLYYQNQLRSNNQIDFSDMINDAERILREMSQSNYKPSYKYIIIDEFQDIARQRFNLTKSLVDVTGAKVVAVGDDWQSIYAFAGSDITLFQKFLELMGQGKEMQITHTYRNSQELIDIAGSFVQKNPSQIKKRLLSPKRLKNPVIVESFDDTTYYRINWIAKIEEVIGKIVSEYGSGTSILLIGRYNYDMDHLIRSGKFAEVNSDQFKCLKYPKARITFLTAHSSKGLGFDNVVLINMIEAKLGFPSQIEEDPIIKLVTYNDNSVPFAEERRLFYVAMTRTKNRVYMVTPRTKPSRFVVELIQDFKIPHDDNTNMQTIDPFILKCPVCGLPLKYENNKNYGIPLYMCTNEPELCDFMTNDKVVPSDIYKCPQCIDGYMIVKKNKDEERFYGCTNYDRTTKGCGSMAKILINQGQKTGNK
ncbi:MAG TPA: UvrD-helicase domain-containing protein [Desulfitobacterium dehalogenans]|uniref:UvrD-helicase domain-containing protein n=1 Tax=Desulfitobacterium dehalogenans TaxID=36854 RepID=A0A7C6Z455_9FIRM|nr:UvrD-helicase domain-containing protein [Desulfitobacterium dehalogenans]